MGLIERVRQFLKDEEFDLHCEFAGEAVRINLDLRHQEHQSLILERLRAKGFTANRAMADIHVLSWTDPHAAKAG
jgi:hypothetical protein